MTQKHSISSPKKFPSKNSTRPTTPVARSETVEDLIQSDEVVSKEDVFKTRTRVIDDRSPAKPGAEAIQRDHSRIPQAREKPSAAAKKDARFLDTLYERARRITTQLDGRDQVFPAAKPTPALEQWGYRSLQEPVAKPMARPAWPDGPLADAPMLVKELSAFTSATYSGPDAAGLLRPSVETTTALQPNGTRAGSSLNGAARSLHLSATRKTQPPTISSAPLSTMTTAQEKEVIEQVALLLQDEMLKSTSEVFMLPEIEAKYLEQFRVDSEKLTMLGDKVDLLSKKMKEISKFIREKIEQEQRLYAPHAVTIQSWWRGVATRNRLRSNGQKVFSCSYLYPTSEKAHRAAVKIQSLWYVLARLMSMLYTQGKELKRLQQEHSQSQQHPVLDLSQIKVRLRR
ncbi:hypothetical protein HDV03_003529 [Kappamyces sp. JEL0829]|nr:hypothetical protein HDV03_003529 [Kappamyces sp. JEL0829]